MLLPTEAGVVHLDAPGELTALVARVHELHRLVLDRLGAQPAADPSRHRRGGGRADPHRDRRRHRPLRLARTPGLLGGAEPRQPRERGQAQVRPHAPRQPHHPLHLVRVRQRRAMDQGHPGGQVQEFDGAQVAQEGHRGRGAQDDPADLHPAVAPRGLPRSGHRLRRHQREEERDRASLARATRGHRSAARRGRFGCGRGAPRDRRRHLRRLVPNRRAAAERMEPR